MVKFFDTEFVYIMLNGKRIVHITHGDDWGETCCGVDIDDRWNRIGAFDPTYFRLCGRCARWAEKRSIIARD